MAVARCAERPSRDVVHPRAVELMFVRASTRKGVRSLAAVAPELGAHGPRQTARRG